MTAWLDDLRVPVLNASMAGAAGGRLAAAVTRAGGLGTIGFGSGATPESVAAECARAEGEPFGVGLMNWVVRDRPEVLTAVIDQAPLLVSLSFGDPKGLVEVVRAAGITAAVQVGTLAEAERALDAGADLLVVRGAEGGGHGRGEVATLPLLQQVLERTDVPVVAAGGIATARGLAAVLAAGAVAAWVGTPFAACVESDFLAPLKQAVVAADSSETVYTRAFDVAQRFSWPVEYGGRALVNQFTAQWADRVADLQAAVDEDAELTAAMNRARAEGDLSMAPVYAGQSAGLVHGERTAAQVMTELAGFRDVLSRAAERWSQPQR